MAFSVYTNGAKVLSTERHEGTMECVHGIRVISMLWVMYGHTYYFAPAYIGARAPHTTRARRAHREPPRRPLISPASAMDVHQQRHRFRRHILRHERISVVLFILGTNEENKWKVDEERAVLDHVLRAQIHSVGARRNGKAKSSVCID
jgi:hypothetical protein